MSINNNQYFSNYFEFMLTIVMVHVILTIIVEHI